VSPALVHGSNVLSGVGFGLHGRYLMLSPAPRFLETVAGSVPATVQDRR
jgi:hypothetical protein